MNILNNFNINNLKPNNIILIIGKRHTGKTILIKHIIKKLDNITEPIIFFLWRIWKSY